MDQKSRNKFLSKKVEKKTSKFYQPRLKKRQCLLICPFVWGALAFRALGSFQEPEELEEAEDIMAILESATWPFRLAQGARSF